MDILISSNLERLVYLITGLDADQTSDLMCALKSQGVYEIDESMKNLLHDFSAGYATEQQVKRTDSETL